MSLTANTLSYLKDPSKILPMLLIEVPTSAGRTYQGYKRGGKVEGQERLFEESLSAVVWLFGVKAFNKIGDFVGEKIFKLKDLNTDVGKDSLRNPFGYVKDKKTLTAFFKFSKILSSAILGTLTMGIIVPKIKIAITNAARKKNGLKPYYDNNGKNTPYRENWADKFVSMFAKKEDNKKLNQNNIINMDDFLSSLKNKDSVSFKGNSLLNGLLYASHNLENNTAWRLLSTDAGTLTGRIVNSRTKKERIEYLTRDLLSEVFYIAMAPLVSSGLSKLTKTPNINPKASEIIADAFKNKIGNNTVPTETFSIKGLNNIQNEIFENIPFTSDETITLEKFNEFTKNIFSKKAELMSKLQPEYIGANGIKTPILSKKQVYDILSSDEISDPVLLKKAIGAATNGKSDDIKAFVSRKRLEQIRDSFDDYIKGLEKYAKAKAKGNMPTINSSIIDDYTKKLNRKNLLIHIAGVGFAVFGLSYLIPKIQYFVSEKITGEKGFLGNSENNKKNNESKQVIN